MRNKSIFIGAVALLAMFLLGITTSKAQIYPHGGVSNEPWVAGAAATVRWDTSSFSGTLRVTLWDGVRAENTTITDSVAASAGSYAFTLSSSLNAGDKYRVRVQEVDSQFTTRMSDSYFSIAPVPPIAYTPTTQNDDPHTSVSTFANVSAVANMLTETSLNLPTEKALTTLSATDDDDFTNPNIICEQTVCKIKTFRIGRLYPQPSTNGIISIDAESNENATDIKAEIYSVTGQKLATVWEGNLKKGASTFMLTVSDIAVGSYILYLKNNKGEIVDYSRVVIAEGQR